MNNYLNHTFHRQTRSWNYAKWPLSGALAVFGLVACSTLTSTQLDEDSPHPTKGIAYCLPLGKVTIEVLRNNAALSKTEDENRGGALDLPPGWKQIALLAQNDATSPQTPNVPTANEAGEPPIATGPATSPKVSTVLQVPNKLAAARAYRIHYKETTYVPDPNKRFTVRYRPNAMMEDNIDVKVTKDSLLDSVNVTTDDKTVEVAKKLIEIGKNIFRIAAQGGIGAFSGEGGQEEVIFTASFDPTSPSEVSHVNRMLRKIDGGPYTVALLDRSSSDYKQATSTYRSSEKTGRGFSGVAFRPALAYGLVLSRRGVPQEMPTVLLPNEAEVLYMPVTRSAFVKKVQGLDFDQGMLVQATVTKPSEALGFVEIPLEITRAILALPGEIAADNIAAFKRQQDTDAAQLAALQGRGTLERGILDEQILNMDKQLQVLRKQEEFLKEKRKIGAE